MSSLKFAFLLFLLVHGVLARGSRREEISFDQNYKVIYGGNHVVSLNQGKEIQLMMDSSSGSGFGSKMSYGSGFFHLRIKVPGRDSAGVVTAYYLTSQGNGHDELDFEFLGNREGKPYTLQTNVYVNGEGNREQRLHLWFDPTANFHDYRILWNPHQIVFYVDRLPIRVYKNKSNVGVGYPSKTMQIKASLWDGDSWATDGGQAKINWSYAPFKANFQGFDVSGCQVQSLNDHQHCVSDNYWWNSHKYWQLDPAQQKEYENVKQKYITYDYCTDKHRYPTPPLECL
ncbi:xyloglucan endotransglucosylase/hydrolase protein 2-like [Gastrolobium bilobum]|uniref:xyloglucan endotransglucosylase/hydrolase protein 2-like n=1 Tax=Gastrolobium bilobum TaxID=150636 RepID=UPI002AAF0B3D|nr:xyloglucan endotransglucosylase/hydrolase protein 2-like [Gastrolobium bilobum]